MNKRGIPAWNSGDTILEFRDWYLTLGCDSGRLLPWRRLARVVVPGVAHHVTQRGNRRQPTFFQEDDYRALSGTARGMVRPAGPGVSQSSGRNKYGVPGFALELNPVRAKLCRVPWRWPWSSAAAHVAGQDDAVVRVAPLRERVKDWRAYLREPLEAAEEELWRRHERTGRPLGAPAFLDRIERLLGRIVRPAKPGCKPKQREK